MTKTTRKTAGELSLQAKADKTKYDPLEVAHALADDISHQLTLCAQRGSRMFDEDEFILMMVIASDPLIQNVRRHKYTPYLYLPKPRQQQAVFLFNKVTQNCKRLWCLPDAKVMATISEMTYVAPLWVNTKVWCDAFFNGTFFDTIRKQHNINLPTEAEYLDLHRAELIKAGCNEIETIPPDPFDFSKVAVEKVIDKYEPIL